MVGSDGSELPVGEARARGREAAANGGVVAVGGTGLPSLVCDFMVVLQDRTMIRQARRIKTAFDLALTLDKKERVRIVFTNA